MTRTAAPSSCTTGISFPASSWYRGSVIFAAAGRFTQSWNPPMRPFTGFGISWWRMPDPAVIHCTPPAPTVPWWPMLSPCSIVPSSMYVTVSIPRCGCQGKPAR